MKQIENFEDLIKSDKVFNELFPKFDLIGICLRADELRIECGINPIYSKDVSDHYEKQTKYLHSKATNESN